MQKCQNTVVGLWNWVERGSVRTLYVGTPNVIKLQSLTWVNKDIHDD